MEVNYYSYYTSYILYVVLGIIEVILSFALPLYSEPKVFSLLSPSSWSYFVHIFSIISMGFISLYTIYSPMLDGLDFRRKRVEGSKKYIYEWRAPIKSIIPLAGLGLWLYYVEYHLKGYIETVFNTSSLLIPLLFGMVVLLTLGHIYFYARIVVDVFIKKPIED